MFESELDLIPSFFRSFLSVRTSLHCDETRAFLFLSVNLNHTTATPQHLQQCVHFYQNTINASKDTYAKILYVSTLLPSAKIIPYASLIIPAHVVRTRTDSYEVVRTHTNLYRSERICTNPYEFVRVRSLSYTCTFLHSHPIQLFLTRARSINLPSPLSTSSKALWYVPSIIPAHSVRRRASLYVFVQLSKICTSYTSFSSFLHIPYDFLITVAHCTRLTPLQAQSTPCQLKTYTPTTNHATNHYKPPQWSSGSTL